jgi:hypothetical protein
MQPGVAWLRTSVVTYALDCTLSSPIKRMVSGGSDQSDLEGGGLKRVTTGSGFKDNDSDFLWSQNVTLVVSNILSGYSESQ